MARSRPGWYGVLPLRRRGGRGGGTGVICGLVALFLYALTCSRGVEWQDSGVHQYRILTGWLQHPLGLALAHPLHYWLGRAALALPLPLGEPAYRLNLLSALSGAAGVGMLAATVTWLTRRRAAAYFAALALLVAHVYWQMSGITETYTLAAALMTIEWYLLLAYARTRQPGLLLAIFAVNGLHVADHLLGLLTFVTYAALALERVGRRRLAWQWLPAFGVAWAVTTAPYWTLVLNYYRQTGDLAVTLHSTFFGGGTHGGGWASQVLNTSLTLGQLKNVVLALGYNFPSLVVPIALIGILQPGQRRAPVFHWVLLGQTVIVCGFVFRYNIADFYTYFVPVCPLAALWFGGGVDRLLRCFRGAGRRAPADQPAAAGVRPAVEGAQRRFATAAGTGPAARAARAHPGQAWLTGLLALNALLPLAVYTYFPSLARDRQWLRSRLRHIPYRDEYVSFFRPWRVGDDSAAVFARAALDCTGPNGWLLAEGTTAYATAYVYRVHGGPPGIRIYTEQTCLNHPGRPELSDAELAAFVQAGGCAIVVPGVVTERLWGERFRLDRSDPDFWRIRPAGSVQTQTNPIHLEGPGDGGRDRDDSRGASLP
jgi:hypothetical protein